MKKMNNLEYQERISRMTTAELIEAITRLTEAYSERLRMLTEELLLRSMQRSV